jgi:hypothetical protein
MKTDALTNPIVKATIEALQNGDGNCASFCSHGGEWSVPGPSRYRLSEIPRR